MRVLQVGARVALEGEHAVPVEDVVAGPLGRQVGVLDRADAEGVGDGGLALGRQSLARSFMAAPARSIALVEQVDQPLRVAAAAGQLLAVRPEHHAEGHVLGLDASGSQPAMAATAKTRRRCWACAAPTT